MVVPGRDIHLRPKPGTGARAFVLGHISLRYHVCCNDPPSNHIWNVVLPLLTTAMTPTSSVCPSSPLALLKYPYPGLPPGHFPHSSLGTLLNPSQTCLYSAQKLPVSPHISQKQKPGSSAPSMTQPCDPAPLFLADLLSYPKVGPKERAQGFTLQSQIGSPGFTSTHPSQEQPLPSHLPCPLVPSCFRHGSISRAIPSSLALLQYVGVTDLSQTHQALSASGHLHLLFSLPGMLSK